MKRNTFIKSTLATLGGITLFTPRLFARTKENEIFSAEEIRDLVFAAHKDFEETKRIIEAKPLLLNCANQGKKGDFETALGGASHMGRRDIADFLIAKGARMDIFNHAFLGHTELVKQMVITYPQLLKSPGPHGFTLLHHAKVGEHKELMAWLEEKGLKETHFKGIFG